MIKAAMMWSGGKDSSFAYYKVLEEKKYDVVCLFSTFSSETKRLSMHGVSEDIIEAQAKSIGLPLIKMYINQASHDAYEKAMEEELLILKEKGISTMIFGDIFLEDLRKYREANLAKIGAKAFFPLWGYNTKTLVLEFIELGFKTICCCVNLSLMDKSFLGEVIDEKWLNRLPENVDWCGENGEFHTCSVDGPIYKEPLSVDCKQVEIKEYRHENEVYQYGFVEIEQSI